MDFSIALILAQDGVVNGAVYALLGLALVLVFAVTRVIFIPQGEFVTFGALTLAMLCEGKAPATVWLLLMGGVTAFVMECVRSARAQRSGHWHAPRSQTWSTLWSCSGWFPSWPAWGCRCGVTS